MAENADVFITPKIKKWLADTARERRVKQEGLACMLLALSLSDPQKVDQAATLLKRYDLGGATDMQKRGW